MGTDDESEKESNAKKDKASKQNLEVEKTQSAGTAQSVLINSKPIKTQIKQLSAQKSSTASYVALSFANQLIKQQTNYSHYRAKLVQEVVAQQNVVIDPNL